jgi:hypothetical protein
MTLDEAIEHAEERSTCGDACAAEHAQLAQWLREYKSILDSRHNSVTLPVNPVELRSALNHAIDVLQNRYARSGFTDYDTRKSLATLKPARQALQSE